MGRFGIEVAGACVGALMVLALAGPARAQGAPGEVPPPPPPSETAPAGEPPPPPPPATTPPPDQASPPRAAPPPQEQYGQPRPQGPQGQYGYGQPPPQGYYAPPPPPIADPTIETHDGFFFRFALGFGYAIDNATFENDLFSGEFRLSGGAAGGELAFGGTPLEGFVLGGSLAGVYVPEPKLETEFGDFEVVDRDARINTINIFMNYYFDPSDGWHLHASLGIASADWIARNEDEPASDETAIGGALAVGVGYDAWVGEQWAIGPFFRVWLIGLGREQDDFFGGSYREDHGILAPMVYFTVTHH